MALPTTDPSALANAATCFSCAIPPGDQLAVQTYLLALIGGMDTSAAGAQALVNLATCFDCVIPPGMQLAVQNYLLVQLTANAPIVAITVFDEDVEWTFSTSAPTHIIGNSASNPHTGLLNMQGTLVSNGDTFTLTAPALVTLSNYTQLSLWLNPVDVGFGATSDLTFRWQDSGGTPTGNELSVESYGFDTTNKSYQNVVIPIADFGLASGVQVGSLLGKCLPKISYKFYLDTVLLQP